jgi:uncharacterized protein (UPF0335 family)
MTDTTDMNTNVVPLNKKGNKRGRFGKPGIPNPGKPRGAVAKNTRLLKEAIMLAAEIEGQDGQGKGKLVGFMRRVAQEDLRAFVSLLNRIIPLQVEQKTLDDKPKTTVYKSAAEVQRELASRGIDVEVMFKIMKADARPMDDDDEPEGFEIENEPEKTEP